MPTRFLNLLSLSLSMLLTSCAVTSEAQNAPKAKKPKNIILLIADGTGLSQISASQFYNTQPSNYDRFKHIGLIKTSSASDLITDSAAGATAFSAGVKTYNGAIGVDVDTLAVPTLLEDLKERGFKTGLVATSTITHATPASFYAHVSSRKMEEEIAMALVGAKVDFFAGGGLKFFNSRSDSINLIKQLRQKDYIISTTILDPKIKLNTNKKYGYLLAPSGMPTILEGRGPFLYNATDLSLRYLSTHKQGFFLMVEGSQVDWGGHQNDGEYLISELIDFDSALGRALDYAEKDGNTLVVVTADHETGGFTLASNEGNYNDLKASFSTGGHSATMVPVFAYGPGATEFTGIYENTAIYKKLVKLLKK